jgi:hypothetical protein
MNKDKEKKDQGKQTEPGRTPGKAEGDEQTVDKALKNANKDSKK